MIKATFFTGSFYLNNRQFDMSDEISNRDDCLYGFYLLKKGFEENGIDLSTQDINSPLESQFIIYNDMPNIRDIMPDKDNYLLIIESKVVKPDNWKIKNHKFFKKIFTWDDNLIEVDGKKYIKINYPHKIPTDLDYDLSKKEKLCTMVQSKKFKKHPLELYTERLKAIRWFEENHPKDFDLYGIGWDRHSSKGYAPASTVLPKYKFAICYENTRDIPGYITEKIFNCFFAGCVPVYWGASNVTDYIPSNTFIDRRKFKVYEANYEELYSYLNSMSDEEYIGYLNAIKSFVKSEKIYPFSAEYFAYTIASEIIDE